ncbi:MAG: hypothetical protein B6D38_09345 [Anaerolineae bacterium UTCFX1]|jgi:DNA modification methylase|nr:MAG: hypothetical protein B6D38_09345 [Anaerolineae bacterium UTCFX1]
MPELIWRDKQPKVIAPAALTLDSIVFPGGCGYPQSEPKNRLIWGDNLAVMAALLPTHENCINLIYADPPFFTNKKFAARIGRGEDSRKPKQWKLAEGYRDDWADLDAYLDFLYQRLFLMFRLLAPNGTLYLHLDWHADSYARLLLDEIFGADRLLNEIIWTYHGPSPIRRAFNRKHDTILSYTKGSDYTFNADAVREPYHQNTINTFKASPKAGFGKTPNLERGKVPEDWWYFPVVARLHNERTGYPTQKPEALLERIILASSNPGDLVADFFCGSGTLPFVATKHDRAFIAGDESSRALHATGKRLLGGNRLFSLERDANVAFSREQASAAVQAKRLSGAIRLETKLDLDYWEIDPDWNGKVFKSAAQAYRPNRGGEIARELTIELGRKGCVRVVTASGERYQLYV